MSRVTDVILCINLEEQIQDDGDYSESCEPIDTINTWLAEHGPGKLDQISESAFFAVQGR